MQAGEEAVVRLERLSAREKAVIIAFLESLRCPGLLDVDRLYALRVRGGKYYNVFEVDPSLLQVTALTARAPYSLGFNAGTLDARSLSFRPSLPLALRACRLCRAGVIECHVLDDRGAAVFTYGKNVWPEHVLAAGKGLKPVISRRGDCLGWGILMSHNTNKYLHPLRDLGWYLRRGG